jgi:hypothetical protein
MSGWHQNVKGNYCYAINTDQIMVVFKRTDEYWAGVYRSRYTKSTFETPEEAMDAMQPILEGDTSMLEEFDSGWKKTKTTNGFYRKVLGRTASVKKAKNGNWYIVIDGVLQTNLWFRRASQAMAAASRRIDPPSETDIALPEAMSDLDWDWVR